MTNYRHSGQESIWKTPAAHRVRRPVGLRALGLLGGTPCMSAQSGTGVKFMGLLDRETGAGEPWVSLWLRGEHCRLTWEVGFSGTVPRFPAPGSLRARGHRRLLPRGWQGRRGVGHSTVPPCCQAGCEAAGGWVGLPDPHREQGPSGQ